MTSVDCSPIFRILENVMAFLVTRENMSTMDTSNGHHDENGDDMKQYFRLMNKLRSNQSECSEYFAKERKESEALKERVVKLISEAKELQTRTECLRSGFREIEEKYVSIKRMLNKEFGQEALKRMQSLEEAMYLNGFISHLKEVDQGLTFRAVAVSDPREYDDL